MKPILKHTLYVIVFVGSLFCIKPVSQEVIKSYNHCVSYMANNVVGKSPFLGA